MKYGFLGCGNMGGALAKALSKATKDILITDRSGKAKHLAEELGLRYASGEEIVRECDRVFLAVKPHMMEELLAPLRPQLRQHRPVLISMAAGLTEVPCIVMQMDDRESGFAALVENLQRQDLDFIEEAGGISRLMELGGLSQEQAARLLGKSQSAIANKLRLLRHSEAVLSALRREGLTERHGRALLKLTEEQTKLEAIAQISRQGMSVAQTEKYVQSLLKGKPDAPLRANVGAFLNSLTQSLSRMQSSGIPAVSERRETDSQIVLTITIPKEKA